MPVPLLMIPGPVEVSEAVTAAYSTPPPSHVGGLLIEAFGSALSKMRKVWLSGPQSQPFVIAGSGTLAMEIAVCNLVGPREHALVVNTGHFSSRMAEMLRRRGARVTQVSAEPGSVPTSQDIADALGTATFKAVFATHVDTSTGVRVDAKQIAALASDHGALSVFDGVCATAAERFEMQAWGADVYLTASQKAIGLPPGLALLVASEEALAARDALTAPPPMSLDMHQWLPIMRAYEERRGSYFSTPATNLIMALDTSLTEILATEHQDLSGIEARFAQQQAAADQMRAAWTDMGLDLLPASADIAANTLSALRYPPGVDASFPGRVAAKGVIVAGGLFPGLQHTYFRVGHMGLSAATPDHLHRTREAIASALAEVRG